jgi:hypothetical protein
MISQSPLHHLGLQIGHLISGKLSRKAGEADRLSRYDHQKVLKSRNKQNENQTDNQTISTIADLILSVMYEAGSTYICIIATLSSNSQNLNVI